MSYSPILGRWIEADPSGYPDGLNRYQWEISNPIKGLDPTGLNSFSWNGKIDTTWALNFLNIDLGGGDSTDYAYLHIKTDDRPPGLYRTQNAPAALVMFSLSGCTGFDSTKVSWHQELHISFDDPNAPGVLPQDLSRIKSAETQDHQGSDPFSGWIDDPGFGPNPFSDTPALGGRTYLGRPSAPIGITKSFQTVAYYDGELMGIEIDWQFHGVFGPIAAGGGFTSASVSGTVEFGNF